MEFLRKCFEEDEGDKDNNNEEKKILSIRNT
jgi:hypothetical protein